MKCSSLRPFLTTLLFAILTLLYVMGLVGTAIVVSHWYSMVKTEPWKTLFGSSWTNTGVTASFFLTIGIATIVMSFSFGKIFWGLPVSAAFQVLGLCLVFAVISRVHENEGAMFDRIKAGFNTLPNIEHWKEENSCNGATELDCENPAMGNCCSMVMGSISDRLSLIFDWLLGFTMVWIVSLGTIVVLTWLLCRRPSSSAPYAK